MRIERMKVTPEQARIWLHSSEEARNRKIAPRRVEQYSEAMRSGLWRLTSQGLSISPDGRIVDGQHRLAAVVAYGEPVEFVVDLDADPSSFDVIDNGKARLGTDILHIAGYTNVNLLSAAGRLLMQLDGYTSPTERRAWQTYRQGGTSHAELLAFMQTDDGERIQSMMQPANRVAIAWGRWGARTPVCVALTMLLRRPVPDSLRLEFVERCVDGAMLGPRSPILAMRRYFIGETGWMQQRQTLRPIMAVAVFLKAYNAWVQGDEVQTMRYLVDREPFPIPVLRDLLAEEQSAARREAAG